MMKAPLLTIALAALLSLVSCQTIDDNPIVNVSTSDLLGFWEGDLGTRLEFCPDGTYYFYLNDSPIWMPADDSIHTYSLEGDVLTVNWTTKDGSSFIIDSRILYIDDKAMTLIDLSDDSVEKYQHLKAGEAQLMGVYIPKYKPKKSIYKGFEDNELYYEREFVYEWEGDLLTKVKNYDNTIIYAENIMSYDELNRLKRIDYVNYDSTGVAVRLDRIDNFYKDRLIVARYETENLDTAGNPTEDTYTATYNISYKDGKIYKMTRCKRSDYSWDQVNYYTWEGNNCVRNEYTYSDEPGTTYSEEMGYYGNHFNNWFGYWGWNYPEWAFNFNECKSYAYYVDGEMQYHSDYFYEYDEQGRISVCTEIAKYTDETSLYKFQETFFYE